MGVTPGVVVDGKLVTNDLVDINLGIRILLGSSFYDDWEGQEMFVTTDPLGNPVDRRHPWNQHTIPQPQKRDFDGKYSWVMSPRWFDGTDHLALDTGGGPIARLWSTALSGLVNTDFLKATGHSVEIHLPKTALKPEVDLRVEDPAVVQHHRARPARTYFQAYAAAAALDFIEKALDDVRAGQDQDVGAVRGTRRGHRLRLHRGRARRALAPHGDPGRQDRQLPPVPADAVERQPPRRLRHAWPVRGRRDEHARSSRRTTSDNFKGIDIMRTVRSFDPCLPCGVHMYLGKGKVLKKDALTHRMPEPDLASSRRSAVEPPRRSASDGSSGCSTSCESSSIRRPTNGPRSWSALVSDLYGAGSTASSSWSRELPSCSRLVDDELVGEPADRPRPPPGHLGVRVEGALESVRPIPRPRAATSSCSDIDEPRPGPSCSACSGAATAARRRRSPCSTPVNGRSSMRHRRSSSSTSRSSHRSRPHGAGRARPPSPSVGVR